VHKPRTGIINDEVLKMLLFVSFPVILAPFGLNGIMTGVTYRDSDVSTRKQVEDWNRFYPVKLEEGRDNDHHKLPNMVEVIVGKCVKKYKLQVMFHDKDFHY